MSLCSEGCEGTRARRQHAGISSAQLVRGAGTAYQGKELGGNVRIYVTERQINRDNDYGTAE